MTTKTIDTTLSDLKTSVGNKEPVEYFSALSLIIEYLVNAFDSQTKTIASLTEELKKVKTQSALAIQWEPKVAGNMLSKQIDILRQDKDLYFNELSAFKKAYADDRITQNYHDFVKFWVETLGYHPFLD